MPISYSPMLQLPCIGTRRSTQARMQPQLNHVRGFISFPTPSELKEQFTSPERAATNSAIVTNVVSYALTSTNQRLFMAFVQNNYLVHQVNRTCVVLPLCRSDLVATDSLHDSPLLS